MFQWDEQSSANWFSNEMGQSVKNKGEGWNLSSPTYAKWKSDWTQLPSQHRMQLHFEAPNPLEAKRALSQLPVAKPPLAYGSCVGRSGPQWARKWWMQPDLPKQDVTCCLAKFWSLAKSLSSKSFGGFAVSEELELSGAQGVSEKQIPEIPRSSGSKELLKVWEGFPSLMAKLRKPCNECNQRLSSNGEGLKR